MSKQQEGVKGLHFPTIEVIERVPGKHDHPENLPIQPNEVRVDGKQWALSEQHPVTVNRISVRDGDAVLVTMTVLARRVRIDSETTK